MNELEILNVSGIECYEKDGVAYLKLESVARGLGFTQTAKSGNEVVRWERVRKYLDEMSVPTCGDDGFIPENIFYRLAMKAKNEAAEKFQALVADEVIPSIRKHGAYMTESTIDRMIASPDFGIKLLTELKSEQDKRKALQAQNAALVAENELQRQTIADFEPARKYMDMILESNGSIATTQIAADYGMSASAFNKLLRAAGIQHKVNGQWILYRRHMGNGYTDSKTIHFNHSDGRADTKVQTYWTQKGRLFIYQTLKSYDGTVPTIEREIGA